MLRPKYMQDLASLNQKGTGMSLRKISHSILLSFALRLLMGCGGGMSTPSTPTAAARFALVANSSSNSISTFAVDPQTGQLTPKSTVPTGGINSRVIAMEPSGRFAYVGNLASNDISVFAINANTGALTPLAGSVPTDDLPVALSFHPSGRFAYVVNTNSSDITVYAADSSGALGLLGAVPARTNPISIT